jgi:hypothetical protein
MWINPLRNLRTVVADGVGSVPGCARRVVARSLSDIMSTESVDKA